MTERKRRQYGSGSITQRSDGKWVGRIEAGWTEQGTRRRIPVVAASEAACKAAMKARIRRLEAEGAPTSGATHRATVKSWADEWLARAITTKRPKSYDTDASSIRKWVVPTIGRKRLDELTPGDVRAVSAAIRQAGRSAATARRCHIVVTKMLRDAILEGHTVPQRVLMVKPPTADDPDRGAIALADAIELLRVSAATPGGSRWAVGLLQGIRQAEALGLTWPRVDLDGGVMDISQQLQPVPYAHGCDPKCGRRFAGDCPARSLRTPDGYKVTPLYGALSLVAPKTQKGRRIIPLVPWTVQALRIWRELAPTSPHGLVWPRPDGEPQTAEMDAAGFVALQDTAQVAHVEGNVGRRYHIHEMRHSCASLLQEAKVDERTITAILGHASIIASNAYIHIAQAPLRDAMERVATRLGIGSTPNG